MQRGMPKTRGFVRRWLPLALILAAAAAAFMTVGQGMISLESLVQHRAAIDAFVAGHRLLAVLAYISLYTVAVALSLPGATFLTVAGGFLFGLGLGAGAAVIGATAGATVLFLVARTALERLTPPHFDPQFALSGGEAESDIFKDRAFHQVWFLR